MCPLRISATTFELDQFQLVKSRTDDVGRVDYARLLAGNRVTDASVTSTMKGTSRTTSYRYDVHGRIESTTFAGGTRRYTYDERFAKVSGASGFGPTFAAAYDDAGRIIGLSYAAPANSNVFSLSVPEGGRDANGSLTATNEFWLSERPLSFVNKYDPLDRLNYAERPGLTINRSTPLVADQASAVEGWARGRDLTRVTAQVTSDARGNVTANGQRVLGLGLTADPLNRLTGLGFQYDTNGNLGASPGCVYATGIALDAQVVPHFCADPSATGNPQLAFDGNPQTAWTRNLSSRPGAPRRATLVIDLGGYLKITNVAVLANVTGTSQTYGYSIGYCADGPACAQQAVVAREWVRMQPGNWHTMPVAIEMPRYAFVELQWDGPIAELAEVRFVNRGSPPAGGAMACPPQAQRCQVTDPSCGRLPAPVCPQGGR